MKDLRQREPRSGRKSRIPRSSSSSIFAESFGTETFEASWKPKITSLHFFHFGLGFTFKGTTTTSTTSTLTMLATLTTMTTVSSVDSSSLRTSTELWWATWTSTTTAGLSTTNYCWLHFQLFRPLVVVVGCCHLPFNGLPLRGDVSIEISFFFFFLGLKFFTNPLFIWQKGAFAATAAVFFFSHFPPYDEELSNSELRTLLRRINSWSLSLSQTLSPSFSFYVSPFLYCYLPSIPPSSWLCYDVSSVGVRVSKRWKRERESCCRLREGKKIRRNKITPSFFLFFSSKVFFYLSRSPLFTSSSSSPPLSPSPSFIVRWLSLDIRNLSEKGPMRALSPSLAPLPLLHLASGFQQRKCRVPGAGGGGGSVCQRTTDKHQTGEEMTGGRGAGWGGGTGGRLPPRLPSRRRRRSPYFLLASYDLALVLKNRPIKSL